MHTLQDLFINTQEQQQVVQNSFLEAKSLYSRQFLVGGEYPYNASIKRLLKLELQKSDPKVPNLINIIESDPVNALRLISIAHSHAYMRNYLSSYILIVVQQFGFKHLSTLAEEIAEESNYSGYFADKASALDNLQRLIMIAKLAKKIAVNLKAPAAIQDETFLIGASVGLMRYMLALSAPELLPVCILDSEANKQTFEKSSQNLFLTNEIDYAHEQLGKMSLPASFVAVIPHLKIPPWNKRTWTQEEHRRWNTTCYAIYLAREIVDEILTHGYESKLYNLVNDLSGKANIKYETLMELVTELPLDMKSISKYMSFSFPELPGYLQRLSKKHEIITEAENAAPNSFLQIYKIYFAEIKNLSQKFKATSEHKYITAALYNTLVMLVKVLKFEKAAIFMHDSRENALKTFLAFGRVPQELTDYKVKLLLSDENFSPIIQAFYESSVTFSGDPIFEDHWPFVSFPMVIQGKAVGVFYADMASKSSTEPLSTEQQMALINLAELFNE